MLSALKKFVSTPEAAPADMTLTTLKGRKGMKLNLGCAGDNRPGFVGLDFNPESFRPWNMPEGAEGMVCNLTKGIPADDESCSYVYSSHFFEHVEYFELKHLLNESFRVLEKGGRIRVAMPNFPLLLKMYIEKNEAFHRELTDVRNASEFRMPMEEVMWADIVSLGLYEWGDHKYFYDVEKMLDLLKRAGFEDCREVPFDATEDVGYREKHSFYTEGRKPR